MSKQRDEGLFAKNGRSRAILSPVDESTDLESLMALIAVHGLATIRRAVTVDQGR